MELRFVNFKLTRMPIILAILLKNLEISEAARFKLIEALDVNRLKRRIYS